MNHSFLRHHLQTKKKLIQYKNCLRPTTFIKKETLAQVFFCEIYETFKNTLFKSNTHFFKSGNPKEMLK